MSGYEPRHPRARPPTPEDPGPADGWEVLTTEEVREFHSSSLLVNVDWLELVGDVGEERAFEVVGKLKDLLG